MTELIWVDFLDASPVATLASFLLAFEKVGQVDVVFDRASQIFNGSCISWRMVLKVIVGRCIHLTVLKSDILLFFRFVFVWRHALVMVIETHFGKLLSCLVQFVFAAWSAAKVLQEIL